MRTAVVFVCVLATIVAHTVRADNQEVVDTLERSHQQCQKNPSTSISNEDGAKLVHGKPLEPSVYAGYVTCVSENLQLQDDNGQPNRDIIKKYLAGLIEGKEDPQDFLDKCEVQKSDSVETAKAIYICFHNALHKYAH